MTIKRRKFLKSLSLSTLFPLTNIEMSSFSNPKPTGLNEFYKKAMIIDGLIIPRGWNEDSFKALDNSGYTGFSASLPTKNLKIAMSSLVKWRKKIKSNSDKLILAESSKDFYSAKKKGKTAVLLGFQNTTMIGNSIENIERLYDAGTRWIQLTYNQRNLLGDGCTERTNSGLSDFGIEAVKKMNNIGIMVDVSHCGRKTTDDAIKFSEKGVSINHSMCEALHNNHPRAKTDKQLKSMSEKGGVIGIICLGYMIGPKLGFETTFQTYLDHIEHAVNVAGIDHVGVAADFSIQGIKASGATKENWYLPRLKNFKPSYKVQWPPWIPELDVPKRYLNVAAGLEKRGYRLNDIEKILGLNWLRYFKEVL